MARLWPRRLRWRLVLGFALTVALLQAALIGGERVLLEQALVRSIASGLETSIRAGMASQTLTQQSTGIAPIDKKVAMVWQKVGPDAALLKRDITRLSMAVDATSHLRLLAKALTLPDQPVAMLDVNGVLLTSFSGLAKDKTRARPLGPAVLQTLVAAARPLTRKVAQEWTGQVATPDGPYLLLLWRTDVAVLTPQQADEASNALKFGPKYLVDPANRDMLQGLTPSPLMVLIAQRLGGMQQTVQTVTAIGLGGALAVIVLASLISLLVVGRALRPLSAVTRGAERLAQGDYRHRVALDAADDEVGRLATAFDRMAAAIGAAFATQRRFVADASHELRTPLTALRGYTDVLQMGVGEDPATATRILHAMQDDLGRMSRLVDDLLTLARLDGGAPLRLEPIIVADLLGAAAHEGRIIAQGRHEIVDETTPCDLTVCGDRDRLRQVLSNIVGNACAYCPPGSTIALRAAACERWAVMTVQDNGPGIAPSDLARLGERFYRGDAARSRLTGGTGLGLAIARAIIEAHGGTLSIDSMLGAGATVTIRLPLASAATPAPLPESVARIYPTQ